MFQVLSLFAAFDFVNTLISGSSRIPMFSNWRSNAEASFVWQVPLTVAVFLALAASFRYRARQVSVAAMLMHEKHCIAELLNTVGSADSVEPDGYTKTDLVRLMSTDVRQYGRLVDAFIDSCLPLIFLSSSVALLFYFSWQVTFYVVLFSLVFIALFFRASRKVASLGARLEENARVDAAERRNLIDGALRVDAPFRAIDANDFSFPNSSRILSFLGVYGERLRVNDRAGLIAGVFVAVLIACVLAYLGHHLYESTDAIADVLIYVVVLNFGLIQIRSLAAVLTKIRVFQGYAARYLRFVDRMQAAASVSDAGNAKNNAWRTNDSDALVQPGEFVLVQYRGAIDKFSLGMMRRRLGLNQRSGTVLFKPADVVKQELLAAYVATFRDVLRSRGLENSLSLIDEELSAFSSHAHEVELAQIHTRVWAILQILHFTTSEVRPVIYIEGRGFRGIRALVLNELKSLLSGSAVVLIYDADVRPAYEVKDTFSLEEESQKETGTLDSLMIET